MKRAILCIAAGPVALLATSAQAALIQPYSGMDAISGPSVNPMSIDAGRSASLPLAQPGSAQASSPFYAVAESSLTDAANWDALVAGARVDEAAKSRADRRRAEEAEASDSLPGHLPEPASWAMMMLGFSALGFTLRRRPKASARIRFS